ncbi:hypothetical protein [Flavobacterium selenitireducens]|uniref:hypothetical protein n=1 Tax=Flavobacterium selenitireducens TaxID=2722704 RepID=UPI00168BB21B|nr:hypothetical protein [Flavobacterium selenitireducens]MBD3582374.1 hypothetical protein [Flavobacterium selenitireducens]
MMRSLLLLLTLIPFLTFSQTPQWTWAKTHILDSNSGKTYVAADESGNAYVAGTFGKPR